MTHVRVLAAGTVYLHLSKVPKMIITWRSKEKTPGTREETSEAYATRHGAHMLYCSSASRVHLVGTRRTK